MGEADEHVDRVRPELPHLDHRHLGGGEHAAGRAVVVEAGQHHGGRRPGEEGAHEAFLGVVVVVGMADQELHALGVHAVLQRGHRVGEEGVDEARHDDADHTGTRAGERAGHQVRHVAERVDRRPDPRPELRRDRVGVAEKQRHRGGRDLGEAGDLGHGDAGRSPAAAAHGRTVRMAGEAMERGG
jgi:hypothetical protein